MAAGTCVYAEVAVVKVGAATEIELNERKRRIERAVRNGLNAATGQYVDRVKDGIVEPAKVTRCALQSARNAPAPTRSAGSDSRARGPLPDTCGAVSELVCGAVSEFVEACRSDDLRTHDASDCEGWVSTMSS